jgi:hypothetical protein
MGNYYKIWVDKYGEEEAIRRQKEKTEKHRKTQKAKMDSMTPEERSIKFGSFGVNNPAKKPENRKKISEAVTNSYNNELRKKRSEHLRKNNPSKSPGASERISMQRIKYYEDPANREKTSESTIKQIAAGKSSNGRTKNYKYTCNNKTYIVQGTYELAFIKWLDVNKIKFRCHEDRIKYTDQAGIIKTYLPDFYVYDWDSYIDVKSTYWYNIQKPKFNAIFNSNPKLNLKILLEHDLRDMGVIY